jgi:hypothetical protein
MKQIIKLDEGKYVHLDSYGKPSVNHLETFFAFCMVLGISAITVGALFGNDVTKMMQSPNQSTPQLKR